jgi:hypothetical protein
LGGPIIRRTQEETPVSEENDYTEEELEGMNEWHRLEHPNLPDGPFRFYFTKLKSGSPEADELFMDPISALTGTLQLEGVNSETSITTTIFGHDRTLKLRMIIPIVAHDTQDNSVSMTSHKVITPPAD